MSEAVLYVVATPIGNLADMTPRAVEVLNQVSLIAVEDTRHSARLLAHFTIKTPLISVHDHNERQRVQTLLDKLRAGQSIALISDAGTPLISDPGFVLVRAVRQAGINVVPIPGCSAVITALCASGIATDQFIFNGFLPAKRAARTRLFDTLLKEPRTCVFYESTHRIVESLTDMLAVLGAARYVVIARELTKTFETIHGDCLAGLLAWLQADPNQQKGEFVVIVEGAPRADNRPTISAEAQRMLDILLSELPVKQAAGLVAKITGEKKNALYQEALNRQQP